MDASSAKFKRNGIYLINAIFQSLQDKLYRHHQTWMFLLVVIHMEGPFRFYPPSRISIKMLLFELVPEFNPFFLMTHLNYATVKNFVLKWSFQLLSGKLQGWNYVVSITQTHLTFIFKCSWVSVKFRSFFRLNSDCLCVRTWCEYRAE